MHPDRRLVALDSHVLLPVMAWVFSCVIYHHSVIALCQCVCITLDQEHLELGFDLPVYLYHMTQTFQVMSVFNGQVSPKDVEAIE